MLTDNEFRKVMRERMAAINDAKVSLRKVDDRLFEAEKWPGVDKDRWIGTMGYGTTPREEAELALLSLKRVFAALTHICEVFP